MAVLFYEIYYAKRKTPTKYIYIEYHLCMSPRRNWDSPTPSPASECDPPTHRNQRGRGAHSPAVRGWGSPNSDEGEKA